MNTKQKDFSKGKLYKIRPKSPIDTTDCYYGSTINPILQRYSQHRASYKQFKQGNVKYRNNTVYSLFDQYGVNNCMIELVEDYPCENEIDLRIREASYILNNPCVNKHIPNRSRKEYYEANRDSILSSKQEYYKANKETILGKRKQNISNKRILRTRIINAVFLVSFLAIISLSLKLVS